MRGVVLFPAPNQVFVLGYYWPPRPWLVLVGFSPCRSNIGLWESPGESLIKRECKAAPHVRGRTRLHSRVRGYNRFEEENPCPLPAQLIRRTRARQSFRRRFRLSH